MSWLARSLANSLRLDDDDDDDEDEDDADNDAAADPSHDDSSPVKRNGEEIQSLKEGRDKEKENESNDYREEEEAQGRGVKEDLTELKQTLTRQLWGVASFLAPPPTTMSDDQSISNLHQYEPSDRSASCDEAEPSDSAETSGIRHEFKEIGGRFLEISKIASDYFPFGSEGNEVEQRGEDNEEELETENWTGWEAEAIGVTDEVLAFARNIAMHPETWLDFPLEEEEDLDDFHMTDAQRGHALAIERLAPRLAALRIELCPCHMTESYFWKVYFVLLHSRLNKHDAEILSTPQVMEARAMWMQELHKQTKPDSDWYGMSTSYSSNYPNLLHKEYGYGGSFDYEQTRGMTADYETEKHPVTTTEMQFIDKSVIEEKRVMTETEVKEQMPGPSSKIQLPDCHDSEDDWLDEEDSDIGSYKATIPAGNEEDISFSDLEDDSSLKPKIYSKDSATSTA